jgi:hypothetical protein
MTGLTDDGLWTVVRYRRPSLLVRMLGRAIGTAEVQQQYQDAVQQVLDTEVYSNMSQPSVRVQCVVH